MRRTSRRRRSRSRSRSRSRNRGADMGDMSYEQYLEAFEKVIAPQSLSLSLAMMCAELSRESADTAIAQGLCRVSEVCQSGFCSHVVLAGQGSSDCDLSSSWHADEAGWRERLGSCHSSRQPCIGRHEPYDDGHDGPGASYPSCTLFSVICTPWTASQVMQASKKRAQGDNTGIPQCRGTLDGREAPCLLHAFVCRGADR